jgi:hypothetical protein
MNRLSDIVKGTVELNLRSVSTLLTLSKDYVKALDGIVRTSAAAPADAPAAEAAAVQPQPVAEPTAAAPEARRPPLLLAGEPGEQVSGAFIINNPSADDLNLAFAVQGQIAPKDVAIIPSSVGLKAGEETVVRVKIKLTSAFEPNRQYVGMVVIPGMARPVLDFVVLCLPAAPSRAKASRAKASS